MLFLLQLLRSPLHSVGLSQRHTSSRRPPSSSSSQATESNTAKASRGATRWFRRFRIRNPPSLPFSNSSGPG